MRTVRTKVYFFEELSEEAQQKAIQKHSDINVDFNWWECTYDDAENIGLKITGFDLERNKHASGNLTLSACEVAQNIINEHGETCKTHQTALSFLDKWNPVFANYMETEDGEDELMELEDEFLNNLLSDYADILQNESEYLQSEEAIKETLIANEYEFTKEGILFN